MRAAHEAHGGGRGVLLVVGVEDEEQVERLRHLGVDLVPLRRHGEHHVQQVRRVAEVVARIDVRLADRLLERPRRQRGQLGDQPVDRDLDRVLVEDLVRVGVERAHAHHPRGEDRHRVRVRGERVEEVPHLLADERVMRDLPDEPIELLAARQLAPDQEVGDLEEGGVLGQLLDRVAAVAKDALLAVEEGDRARAGSGVGVARVVRDQPGRAAQPADVDRVVARGAAHDRQLGLGLADLEARGIGPGGRLGRHASSSSTAARSSSSSAVVASILERANAPCSMPCTISTRPGRRGPQGISEDQALRDVVAAGCGSGDGGAELLAGRLRHVADGVDHGVRRAGRRALAAGLDDRRAPLLDARR